MIDVTRVDYIRIPVDDIDAANRFYGEVLGLRRNPSSPADDWVEYEASNVTLGVPDVAEAKAKLETAGVEVGEMWDSGVCRGAGLNDPAGNRILLHHRYAPYGPR